jgi:hypothetical protein
VEAAFDCRSRAAEESGEGSEEGRENKVTASEFASMLHAKRVGRGKYVARCPAHADKRPSLSISEGRKISVVICCKSQGCTGDEIIRAMGLTWKDVLNARPASSSEVSKKLRDEQTVRLLRDLKRAIISPAGACLAGKQYRLEGLLSVLERRIVAIENRLDPALKAIRERDAKVKRFVLRWGWDSLWQLYFERSEEFKESSHSTAGFCVAVGFTEQGSTRPIPPEFPVSSVSSVVSVTTESHPL